MGPYRESDLNSNNNNRIPEPSVDSPISMTTSPSQRTKAVLTPRSHMMLVPPSTQRSTKSTRSNSLSSTTPGRSWRQHARTLPTKLSK